MLARDRRAFFYAGHEKHFLLIRGENGVKSKRELLIGEIPFAKTNSAGLGALHTEIDLFYIRPGW
jgi:hypothetical protein